MTDADFIEFLDSVEDPVTIFGLTFSPSDIVKNLDPIAFRVMKSDYEAMMEEENEYFSTTE
jgi:PHD/YefM family antitoxin component YafN of YafNO toxin-antitoxin module